MITMVNERDDSRARPNGKGRKLRHQGSNPTGSQKLSFTPEYSGELNSEIGSTALIKNVRLDPDHEAHQPTGSDKACCQDLGLVFKVPLS